MNATIKGFIRKEFIQVMRDKRMRFFLLIAPIIQLTLFGYAISNEVRNIRMAVYAQPDDVLAKRVAERCWASHWFIQTPAQGDPYSLVQSGRAEAVLVAPTIGMDKSIKNGIGEVQLLLDATNMIRARSVEQYVKAVAYRVMSEAYPQTGRTPSLAVDVRILYNPAMHTSYFLVPGVMVMLLCILTIIMTSMSIVREREMGTFETLVTAPVKNWEILIGKTVPFVILALIQVTIILAAAVLIFGLPMRGPLWKFYLAAFVFIGTTVSVGTMISTISRTQQQAMMGSFLFMFPGILLSGLMFPLENMPKAISGIAYLNPLKYFLTLLRNILLKGGDDWVFWNNLGALAILAVLAIGFSAVRFRQTLN